MKTGWQWLKPLPPPGPVRLVGRQQPHHQPNQLAGGQDKGPLVLVLGHFVIFAVIISLVLNVVHPNSVGGFTEVVTQIAIAIADERRMFGLELIRLGTRPANLATLAWLKSKRCRGPISEMRPAEKTGPMPGMVWRVWGIGSSWSAMAVLSRF